MMYVLVGVIALALWALYYFLSKLTDKYIVKDNKTLYYISPLIASFIPALVVVIIQIVKGDIVFSLNELLDLEYWGIILLAVVISSTLTIVFSPSPNKVEPMELSMRCVHGGLMEIPERVMIQGFVLLIMEAFNANQPNHGYIVQEKNCVLIASIVICLGIVIEALIKKDKNYKALVVKVLSSLIFSLLVGHVYYFSQGCIIYCIVGHMLERFISNIFYIRKKITDSYDYNE